MVLYKIMQKIILYIALLFTLSSCMHGKIPHKKEQLSDHLVKSDELRKFRSFEAKSMNLVDKEAYFYERLKQKFIIKPEYLVKRYHVRDGSYTDAYIDESLLFLSYLALKYKETKDKQYQKLAHKIIKGLYFLENLDGFNGFLPRYVIDQDDKYVIAKEQIKTNSYALLAFAYLISYQNFDAPIIKKLLTKQITTISKYFLDNDLNLVKPNGEDIKYAQLKAKIVTSRQLDGLAFFEAANVLVQNPEIKAEIEENLAKIYHKKYRKKNKNNHARFLGFWEFASPSSNWLNFIKLYTAIKATNDEIYKAMFEKLYFELAKEHNVFYDLLYVDIFPDTRQAKISNIAAILHSFPLSLNNKEVLNSKRADLELKKFPKVIKNKRWVEVKNPLPIYERPLVYHEWKRNQLRVNGNFGMDGEIEFSGLDYLLAYAFYRKK